MNLDQNIFEKISESIFSLNNVSTAIKEIDGPYLYAHKNFYKTLSDFIKVKNIVGKTDSEIFLKKNLVELKNDSVFENPKYNTSLYEVVLRNKKKVKAFFFIKFRIKKLPQKIKIKKKLIGIMILETVSRKFQNFDNNLKTPSPSIKFSQFIKMIEKAIHPKQDEDKQNKSINKTRIEKIVQQIEKISSRDFLTNLYNRHVFERIVKLEIKKSKRYKYPISLLIIDIDNFKIINDNYGHLCGDEILKALSKTFIKYFRETDYICRWGGEEFVTILPKCDLKNAHQVSNGILNKIRKQVFKPSKITVSIGTAQLKPNENTTSWFIRADEALLRAKREGRNRVVISLR